jgi:hypothetical protein
VGEAPDVSRATGLHVVLPTGIGEDKFFAGGTQSLAAYQGLYPGLPWTTFLTAWTTGQATTAFVDQGASRAEEYLAWDPVDAAAGVDFDFWLLEPSGNLYIPYLGTVTPNGYFTAESQVAGVAYEGWLTRRYLEVGTYVFYANLWSDPAGRQPRLQFYFRTGQSNPFTPLYAPGTEPQLSLVTSWLSDPDPTLAEADGGAYSDLVPVAVLEVAAAGIANAYLARPAPDGKGTIQTSTAVVSGGVSLRQLSTGDPRLAPSASRAGAPFLSPRTVTPSITARQLATAQRLLGERPTRRPAETKAIRRLP